jgi:predicted metal-binding membrane protein
MLTDDQRVERRGWPMAWQRDVRAGAHHGAYCLGCCWSLMALFVVVGMAGS